MHSMNTISTESVFDSKSPEHHCLLSLSNTRSAVEMDFSANPNILLDIEEFCDVVGLSSPVQAGILVNQDQSCWLTNLGRPGTTEVYRPDNKRHRKLAYNQVAYVRHGDLVGFYGNYFKVFFGFSTIQLRPVTKATL